MIGPTIPPGSLLPEALDELPNQNLFSDIYRGRLSVVDVHRFQTESGQIAPTSPSALSHSAWSSAPWELLRYPREPSNLLALMGSWPARPDRLRQENNNNTYNPSTVPWGLRIIADKITMKVSIST